MNQKRTIKLINNEKLLDPVSITDFLLKKAQRWYDYNNINIDEYQTHFERQEAAITCGKIAADIENLINDLDIELRHSVMRKIAQLATDAQKQIDANKSLNCAARKTMRACTLIESFASYATDNSKNYRQDNGMTL